MNTKDQREYLMQKCAEYGIPDYMHEGVVSYCIDGRPTGDFLEAVIEGDLFKALGHADLKNRDALFSYALFFYNAQHGARYGYKGAYAEHIERKAAERAAAQEVTS